MLQLSKVIIPKFVLFPQLAVLNKKTSKKYEKSEESWIESKVYEDQ